MHISEDHQRDLFAERLVRSQDRIYAYVVTLLPNWREADDVFQQTNLVLWEKWRSYDSQRDFLNWARGVALNVVRNHLRGAKRDRLQFSGELIEQLAQWDDGASGMLDDRRTALRSCLNDLPDEQALWVLQCYNEGKLRKIAEEQGIASNTLYSKLRRIRQILFECISRRIARGGKK